LSYNQEDEIQRFINKTVERIQDGTIKDEETAKAISGDFWGEVRKKLEEKNIAGSNGSKLSSSSLTSNAAQESA